MSKWNLLKRIKNMPKTALFFAVLSVLSGEWTASVLAGGKKLFTYIPYAIDYQLEIKVFVVALFIFSVMMLYLKRCDFLSFRNLYREEAQAHRAIIFLLSPSQVNNEKYMLPDNFEFPLRFKHKNDHAKDIVLQGDDLENDITDVQGLEWNWQQLLRALKPHKRSLAYAYFIGSESEKGSHKDIENARKVICRYFGIDKKDSPGHDNGIDFENLQEVIQSINSGIDRLRLLDSGLNEKNIVIDITGGRSTSSVAAALITINRNITFQYVQSSSPNNVWAYDVFHDPPSSV